MEQKILAGVDELTIVLLADKTLLKGILEWEVKAESMIKEFAQLANLESIFGTQADLEGKPPQGYAVAYQYGNNPFYFAVAYHPSHPAMGVVVKFSAHSWAVYCEKGSMNIKKFLHQIQSKSYKARLSRVDFAIDYQNWNLSVDDIYQKLMENYLEIQDYKSKKNYSEISALEVDGVASTFYVGSRRTGTKLFLRVYDKREEQIEKRGFRFQEALYTKSWVRFEAVFKGDYAHQLTDIIMETDEENLENLIVDKIAEKYRFYDLESEKYTDFSIALLEKSKGHFQHLHLKSTRDNDLINSILHLVSGSGLFPVLYKCDEIWGNETSMTLLEYLHDIYIDDYAPNDDVLCWLKKHHDTMAKQSLKDDLDLLRSLQISKKEESA